jgi:two-component system response regulator FlrC
LNVFPVQIPALRERRDDILPLAERMVQEYAQGGAQGTPLLSEEAKQRLQKHSWPGNVRELDNVIQRALILQNGAEIQAKDIQFESLASHGQGNTESALANEPQCLGEELKDHEYRRILAVLRQDNGNRQTAAEKLGISQRTLRYKLAQMRELGMSVPGRYGVESV